MTGAMRGSPAKVLRDLQAVRQDAIEQSQMQSRIITPDGRPAQREVNVAAAAYASFLGVCLAFVAGIQCRPNEGVEIGIVFEPPVRADLRCRTYAAALPAGVTSLEEFEAMKAGKEQNREAATAG